MSEKKVEVDGLTSWEDFKGWFLRIFKFEPSTTTWESFLYGVRKGEALKAQQIFHLQARNSELVEEKRALEKKLGAQTPQGVETPLSISQWAAQEFGQGPILNYGLGALQEMAELIVELQRGDRLKARDELSDVDICLDRLAFNLGHDRRIGVDQKMKVNRSRRWKSNGDGIGQHLKAEAEAQAQAQMLKPGKVLRIPLPKPQAQEAQSPAPETWVIEYSANGVYWGRLKEKGEPHYLQFRSFGEVFDFIPQAQERLNGKDPSWFKLRIKGLGLAPGGGDIIIDGDLNSIFPMSD